MAAASELALDQLHREEVDAVGLLDGVHRHDVRVVEGRDRARFLLEACEAVGVAGHRRGQHLKGHLTPEPRVGGAIDLAHPAGANGGGDLVVSEGSANHNWPGL